MSTVKLYYKDAYRREFEAVVLSCESVSEGYEIVLDQTAFYPEGGGQPADIGMLGQSEVIDVRERGEEIVHICKEALPAGTAVHGSIDWARRFDHMQQHSGEHIVSGMICSAFGCDNTGFHMGEEVVEIDYNCEISWEELLELEQRANAYLWEDHAFEAVWPDREELKTIDYRSKKELEGAVRITRFPGADCCACCGTHVARSSQVGIVKFLSCQKFRNGVRIELLCGERAYRYLAECWTQNRAIAKALSTNTGNTFEAVEKVRQEAAAVRGRADRLEEQLYEMKAASYKDRGNVILIEEEMAQDGPRKLCDLIASVCGGRCMVFSGSGSTYRYAVIHKGKDIRSLIKEMNAALNGRGGGKDGFAQGSVQADAAAIRAYCESLQ